MLGLAGACAVITTGTLLAHARWLDFLRFCGEHSIVIYLAFFLPMAATRTLLLKSGLIPSQPPLPHRKPRARPTTRAMGGSSRAVRPRSC